MARSDLFHAAFEELDAPTLTELTDVTPPIDHERRRGVVKLKPVDCSPQPILSIDAARAEIRAKMDEYLAMDHAAHMLLVALPPGSGKTTEAVRQAEQFAMQLRGRVLYAGPRHELWTDLMRESTFPAAARDAWWYHWQSHRAGDPDTGQGQTCRWARQFREWTERGHQGIQFCRKPHVCGYDYINEQCVYHAQKERQQPIVFVQHQDIVLGHPFLKHAQLLIGDENPQSAFLHDWRIPAHALIPSSIFPTDGHTVLLDADTLNLLRDLRDLVDRAPQHVDGTAATAWQGEALLAMLGGPEHVHTVCDEALLANELFQVPPLRGGPDAVDSVPYAHLRPLLLHLRNEAAEALAGRAYVSRVRITRAGLRLLLRRQPESSDRRLPDHIIWLDATANTDVYELMFDRKVVPIAPRVQMAGRVYQVTASLNNRDTMLGEDVPAVDGKRGKNRSAKRADVSAQVAQIVSTHGYTRPAVVTYKDLKALFQARGYDTAHFYGLRGSNAFTSHDALIVVGTPQPTIEGLIDQAAMLHQERMRPFNATWSDQVVRYGAHAFGYAVSGFHYDDELHALLQQSREAELIQAAHRVRPLFRPVDVWLLTNLPLADLPPDALLNLNDLYDAPHGVNRARWTEVEALATRLGGKITTADLVTHLHLPERTAQRWIDAASHHPAWKVRMLPSDGGRPMRVLVRTFAPDFPPRVNK